MQMKKNNQKQKTTETKTVIKWKPAHLYHEVEQWLTEMSLQGWHLIEHNEMVYTFEKGTPEHKEYFKWLPLPTKGGTKYYLFQKYPLFKRTFGVNYHKSKLNKFGKNNYSCSVIEIDTERLNNDSSLRASYNEIKQYRNRLYTKKVIVDILGITLLVIGCFVSALIMINH